MHQFEGLVDLLQTHRVGYERGQIDIAFHRVLDHAGELCPSLDAAESGPLPYAARDELEWAGGDFLARAGNADHDRLTPATVR